jgi:hypothetical protein
MVYEIKFVQLGRYAKESFTVFAPFEERLKFLRTQQIRGRLSLLTVIIHFR